MTISKSKHPDIRRLQQNICPRCNKNTIRNITGKKEVSHISDCGIHLYYKEYSGFKCELGYENGIIQYEFTRMIFYLLIPIVILLLAFVSTMPTSEDPGYIVLGMWTFVFVAGFLRILAYNIRKEFEFYFAKAYIKVASDDDNETKKSKYFMKGIKFFDRYLRRIFNAINRITLENGDLKKLM
jgi:hypothetical protein